MTEVNVSTSFFPTALLEAADNKPPDLIIRTSDYVFFYCHQALLRERSTNGFGGLLSPYMSPHYPSSPYSAPSSANSPSPGGMEPTEKRLLERVVLDDSTTFNIALNIVYSLSCERYGPSVDDVKRAFNFLINFGLRLPGPESDIWTILIRQASSHPIQVYALGAAGKAHSVCVLASPFTLGASLYSISDGDVITMGPSYCLELFLLHTRRIDALKRILGVFPLNHRATAVCSGDKKDGIEKGWLSAAADILLRERIPNTTAEDLMSSFGPLASSMSCMQCKGAIQTRIATMLEEWALVKNTI